MRIKAMGVPNERQALFLTARQRFVAYGGARGGGKSWAVRFKAMVMALRWPGIRILILRRSYPELEENHIRPLCRELLGVARYVDQKKALTFPNGSVIRFGYCDSERDVDRYQGHEYDLIFIDEATQFTERMFDAFKACNRGVNGYPKRMYLTCNPGGVGHAWVKRLFIDRDFREGETPGDYTFILAKVYDNKILLEKDPDYLKNLQSLPDDLRRAWLEGDWDVFAGQYFTEFRRDRHVIEPFVIPAHWRRYLALDYGLDMLACYWAAFDERGRGYVYRELYEPELVVSEAARKILALTGGEPLQARLAPADLWGRSGETGISQAERFAREGLLLTQVKQRDRVAGWMSVKEWLRPTAAVLSKISEAPRAKRLAGRSYAELRSDWETAPMHQDAQEGKRSAARLDAAHCCEPALQIFSNCQNLIRCLPLLQHDAHNPNDCATEPHEITHAPDALRYLLAGRPVRTRVFDQDEPRERQSGDEALAMFGV